MPFEFERLAIKDVVLIKPKVFGDNRGFFMESYKKSDFFKNGITAEFSQDNHSKFFPLSYSPLILLIAFNKLLHSSDIAEIYSSPLSVTE